jgi:CIC family chloride channel protein
VRDVLAGLTVKQFLTPQQPVPTLRPADGLEAIIERLESTPFSSLPLSDEDGRLLGIVCLEQVHLATRLPSLRRMVLAADLMRADVEPLHANDQLDYALELFVENNLLELPVVDDTSQKRLLGIVRRVDVSGTYLRHVHGLRNRLNDETQRT